MATPSLPKLDNLVSAIQNSINTKLQNSTSEIRTDINILQDYTNTKANDSSVVHTTGDETIEGTKTFSSQINGSISGSSTSCTGNSASATELATARTINIQDSDGTNTGTAVTFNGTADGVIKLPATIKATLTGNADTATKATQDASGNVITDTYATKTELNTKASDSAVVHTSNTETVSGTKTFTSTIVGDITGNAGTCKVRFINLVNNNDDLARVMNFTPPSLADVFNSWYRFSHANNYVQYNSSNAVGAALLDIEAWAYDSENNVIKNTRNTATYVGFVSPDSYNKFTIKTEIGSLTSGDDDSLSIVIAFMRDVNGIEHHISVVRDGGRNDAVYNKFNLVYDYNYTGFGDAKAVLASGKDLITIKSGWHNHTALIYAERDGNKITVKTTEMDSTDFTATLTYTLPENKGNLDEEDYRNIKYMLSNKCQIGFDLHSQEGQFKLLEMSNIFDDLNIFDAANDVIYEYINGSFVQTERKVSDELADYTRVYNKNIKKEFIYYGGVVWNNVSGEPSTYYATKTENALKANDADVVHIKTTESITGRKNFDTTNGYYGIVKRVTDYATEDTPTTNVYQAYPIVDKNDANLGVLQYASRTTGVRDLSLYVYADNGSTVCGVQVNTNKQVVPNVNNSITLGSYTNKWANVYATTYYGNLVGGLTLNQTSLKMTVKDSNSGTTRTNDVLCANSSNSVYGLNVALGGSGNTIVGAGESYTAQLNELEGNDDENLYLMADTGIYFKTGANTFANAKTLTLSRTAELSGLAKVTSTSFVGTLTGDCYGGSGSFSSITTSARDFQRNIYGNYGTFWRNDGNNLYLLITAKGDQTGNFTTARPIQVSLSTGVW